MCALFVEKLSRPSKRTKEKVERKVGGYKYFYDEKRPVVREQNGRQKPQERK